MPLSQQPAVPTTSELRSTPAPSFQVLEHFLQGKNEDPTLCEDALVVLPQVVAVIDGQTSKSPRRFNGLPGGLFAKEVLSDAFLDLDPEKEPWEQVTSLSQALDAATKLACPLDYDTLGPADRPTAGLMYFLPQRGLLVSVGDCQALVNGQLWRLEKESDKLLSNVRARVLSQCLAEGVSAAELLALPCDPGRQHILPMLRVAETFRNTTGSEFSFGAMDGTPVPLEHIRTCTVDPGQDLVLATDGYPALMGTLAESEELLAQALQRDPLCIAELQGTKPLSSSLLSFDDRTYARIRIDCAPCATAT